MVLELEVSTCASVKLWSPVIVETTSTNSTVGRSSGRVMEKKQRIAPAPSSLAASYISSPIDCIPARKMIAL